ncbi:MAG: GFA family protein [Colwellia sp.]|nr:GFA family protein [Colwellia sp.]
MIQASCHCGQVKFTLAAMPETVTSCNCSACSRFSALWAYFEPENIKFISAEKDTGKYCWGDKTIEFHHCKNCACITHYRPTAIGNQKRMAVNFRLVDSKLLDSVKIRYFDGADSWEFINQEPKL